MCACVCVYSWLAENTPHYYSLAMETVGPVLKVTTEKLKVAAVLIGKMSTEAILWVQENIPLVIDWVSYTRLCFVILLSYCCCTSIVTDWILLWCLFTFLNYILLTLSD